jgi:hypothetical protein
MSALTCTACGREMSRRGIIFADKPYCHPSDLPIGEESCFLRAIRSATVTYEGRTVLTPEEKAAIYVLPPQPLTDRQIATARRLAREHGVLGEHRDRTEIRWRPPWKVTQWWRPHAFVAEDEYGRSTVAVGLPLLGAVILYLARYDDKVDQ